MRYLLPLLMLAACVPSPEVWNKVSAENDAADSAKCHSMGFKGRDYSNCLLELHKARVEVCGKLGEADNYSLRVKRLHECIPVNNPKQ